MSEEIYQQVVEVISRYARNEDAVGRLNRETTLIGDLKVNSTRLIDIILDFEDHFHCQIPDADADSIVTIGDATDLLIRLKQ